MEGDRVEAIESPPAKMPGGRTVLDELPNVSVNVVNSIATPTIGEGSRRHRPVEGATTGYRAALANRWLIETMWVRARRYVFASRAHIAVAKRVDTVTDLSVVLVAIRIDRTVMALARRAELLGRAQAFPSRCARRHSRSFVDGVPRQNAST